MRQIHYNEFKLKMLNKYCSYLKLVKLGKQDYYKYSLVYRKLRL